MITRVMQDRMSQHENHVISEKRKCFCDKFCSFFLNIHAQQFVAQCCIYLTQKKLRKRKLGERILQNADVIIKAIARAPCTTHVHWVKKYFTTVARRCDHNSR